MCDLVRFCKIWSQMFRTIKTIDDFHRLQQDILNVLSEWTKKWQLKFNISKCNWLHLGQPHRFGEYTIDGTTITFCNVVKDLGVQLDSQLKFHDHTTTITKKANCLLAIIQKNLPTF